MSLFNTASDSGGSLSSLVYPSQHRRLKGLLIFIASIQILLVWSVRYVPLVDLPLHLANTEIFRSIDHVPQYASVYERSYTPVPNLGCYFIISPLLSIMPAEMAGKTFISLAIITFVFSCYTLGAAISTRPTWNSALCAFLFTGSAFVWGFINYLLGVGLFLIAFALWVRWKSGWSPLRVSVIAVLSALCYLVHLSSFSFLVVSSAAWSVYDWRHGGHTKRVALSLIPLLLPPISLFLFFMRSSGAIGPVNFASIYGKLAGLAGFVATYHGASFAVIAPVVAVALFFLYRSLYATTVVKPALWASLALLFCWLISPGTILSGWMVDVRWLLPGVTMLVLSFEFTFNRPRSIAPLLLLFVSLTARIGVMAWEWQPISDRIQKHLTLFDGIEYGKSVFVLADGDMSSSRTNRPLSNALSYLIITHKARVTSHWTSLEQAPIGYRNFTYHSGFDPVTGSPIWNTIFHDNDYIWAFEIDSAKQKYLDQSCQLLCSNDEARLYRVRKHPHDE